MGTLIVGTATASSLRGSNSNSKVVPNRNLSTDERFTFGTALEVGCPVNRPLHDDTCTTYQQQCKYPIVDNAGTTSMSGTPSYWTCNCNSADSKFDCRTRCEGPECIGPDTVPIEIPEQEGRIGSPPSLPQNQQWCPAEQPATSSQCKYPGVKCAYQSSVTSYQDCECEFHPDGKGSSTREWMCQEVTNSTP